MFCFVIIYKHSVSSNKKDKTLHTATFFLNHFLLNKRTVGWSANVICSIGISHNSTYSNYLFFRKYKHKVAVKTKISLKGGRIGRVEEC